MGKSISVSHNTIFQNTDQRETPNLLDPGSAGFGDGVSSSLHALSSESTNNDIVVGSQIYVNVTPSSCQPHHNTLGSPVQHPVQSSPVHHVPHSLTIFLAQWDKLPITLSCKPQTVGPLRSGDDLLQSTCAR